MGLGPAELSLMAGLGVPLAMMAAVAVLMRRWLHAARVENASLRERLQVVSRLHLAGRALNSAHELDQVLDTILAGAVEMLGASRGSVMLLEESSLTVVATVGNDRLLGLCADVGEGIAGQVAGTRRPLLINGVASPQRFPGLVAKSAPVDSAISVPMVEAGVLIGVLNVAAPPIHVFAEQDLATARAFAEYAAAAIAKARLYETSQRTSAELAHRATHDALTGLANRTLLHDTVVGARQRRSTGCPCGALLFIDLDGFKAVNDVLGHAGGDLLLKAVAGRIAATVSSNDTAARVGGDEFAVFLSSPTELAAAVAVADRIVERLGETFVIEERHVSISASIGIALVGAHGDSFDQLMKAADAALYQAKKSGKGRWQVCGPAGTAAELGAPRQRTGLEHQPVGHGHR